MIHCLSCNQYEIQYGDRYCGLCGKPTQVLDLRHLRAELVHIGDSEIEEEIETVKIPVWGRQIELPENLSGAIDIKVTGFRNTGCCPLSLQFEDTDTSGVIRLFGSGRVDLLTSFPLDDRAPFSKEVADRIEDPGGALEFKVDCDALRSLQPAVIRLPYREAGADRPMGELFVAFAIDGTYELTGMTASTIKLGRILCAADGSIPSSTPFSVTLHYSGSSVRRVDLQKQSSSAGIQVSFACADEEPPFLVGPPPYRLQLKASASQGAAALARENITLLLLDPTTNNVSQQLSFDIEAETSFEPKPYAEAVSFDKTLPRLIATARLTVENRGGASLEIANIRLDNRLPVRLVEPFRKRELKAGEQAGYDLAFSTSYSRDNANFPRAVGGIIEVEIKSPDTRVLRIPWDVEIVLPRIQEHIFGIDFGTSNSYVYTLNDLEEISKKGEHEEKEKRKQEEDKIIPSMLAFLDKDFYFTGKLAENHFHRLPAEQIVLSVKRTLAGGDLTILRKRYTQKDLVVKQMEQLLLTAAKNHNAIPSHVALSVPVSFNDDLRNLLRDACREAWQLTELRKEAIHVIDEPTAVGIYCYQKYLSEYFDDVTTPKHLLVFDLGGGTLDVAILRISEDESTKRRIIEPILARGDEALGGLDFDVRLIRYLAGQFKKQHADFESELMSLTHVKLMQYYENEIKPSDLSKILGDRIDWKWRVGKLKHDLTNAAIGKLAQVNMLPSKKVRKQVDELREHFEVTHLPGRNGVPLNLHEERIAHPTMYKDYRTELGEQIEGAKRLVTNMLTDAQLEPASIDVAILTGQSCCIPFLRDAILSLFPNSTRKPSPDDIPLKTSVAMGAAASAYFAISARTLEVKQLNHSSYSYGILLDTHGRRKHIYEEFIPIGHRFGEGPVTKEIEFHTHLEVVRVEVPKREYGLRKDAPPKWGEIPAVRDLPAVADRVRIEMELRADGLYAGIADSELRKIEPPALAEAAEENY